MVGYKMGNNCNSPILIAILKIKNLQLKIPSTQIKCKFFDNLKGILIKMRKNLRYILNLNIRSN